MVFKKIKIKDNNNAKEKTQVKASSGKFHFDFK